MRKPLLYILFLLLVMGAVMAAAPGLAQETQDLDRGRITTTDAQRIEFDSGQLTSEAMIYDPEDGDDERSLAVDDILRVEIQRGNSGGTYALVGGLSGLVGGLLGANTSSSGVEVSSSTKTTVVAITTGVCAIVGYFVGAGQKKYESVYENPILGDKSQVQTGSIQLPADSIFAQVALRF